jgi:hypothetical protein
MFGYTQGDDVARDATAAAQYAAEGEEHAEWLTISPTIDLNPKPQRIRVSTP